MRYIQFIQVDDQSLRSVTEGIEDLPDNPAGLPGYVNLVDADWKPLSEVLKDYDPDQDARYEEIGGCREENVGWMVVPAHLLGHKFYLNVGSSWDNFYVRPPGLVNW